MKPASYSFAGAHRRLTFNGPVPESKRVYRFPGGDTIEIENVEKVQVSAHGNHMLLAEGTVTVVPFGWLSLSYPADADQPPDEVLETDPDTRPFSEAEETKCAGDEVGETIAAFPKAHSSRDLDSYRTEALSDVNDERDYQVDKWSGKFDDRQWNDADWTGMIEDYLYGKPGSRSEAYDFRTRMVKVAALAVAAIESHDRKTHGV